MKITKIIAVCLAVMMMFGAVPTAFAADDSSDISGPEIICAYPPADEPPTEKASECEPICIYPTQPTETDTEYETGEELPAFEGELFGTVKGLSVVYRPGEPLEGKVVRKIGMYIFFVDSTFDTCFGICRELARNGGFVPLKKAYDEKLIDDGDLGEIVNMIYAKVKENGFCTAGDWSVMENAEYEYENLKNRDAFKDTEWIAKIGEDKERVLFYAGKGDLTEKGEDFTMFDYRFTDILCPAQCKNSACLYFAGKNNDGSFSTADALAENSGGYFDYPAAPFIRLIRAAEAEGVRFPFTVKHKLGDDAEKEINALYKSGLDPHMIIDFKKYDDFNVLISTSMIETCMYYDKLIGHYVFNVPDQQIPYDIGVYITKDGVGYTLEGAYDKGVINDDDMDKAAELFSKYNTVKKLTDKELEITADLAKAGLISSDSSYNKHIIGDFWTRKSFDNDPRTFGLIELYHFAGKYSGDKLPNARIIFVNGWEIRLYTVSTDDYIVMYDRGHGGQYQTLESFLKEHTDESFLEKLGGLTDGEVEARRTEGNERVFADYAESFDKSYYAYDFREIGEVGGYMMCCAKLGNSPLFGAKDGEYRVAGTEGGPALYFIKDGKVYTTYDVIGSGVSIAQIKEVCEKSKSAVGLFTFTKINGEPYKYQTLLDAVNAAEHSLYTEDELNVKSYKKLSDGKYLVQFSVKGKAYPLRLNCYLIDKYIYRCGEPDQAYILCKKNLYTLSEAYEKSVINPAELKKAAKLLNSMKENKETVRAGKDHFVPSDFFVISGDTISSDKKVVKINKDGTLTALTKGKATITHKAAGGKAVSATITVKDDPKLSEASVKVKVGKTVRVRISGKAASVNNVYKNTRYAKITSKKSADTLTVKGLKKGKTTLTVTVNGKKLKLKVNVK